MENEGVELENEGVENDGGATINTKYLSPERNGYHLQNTTTINYNDEISNQRSMGCIKLIVDAHYLQNVTKAYVNIVNAIAKFVETNPPSNIITHGTILTQYSIKQGLQVFEKKARLQFKKIGTVS